MELLITAPKGRKDKDSEETVEHAIDFRVSMLSTLLGEKIVIRVLELSTERLNTNQLGYELEQKQLLFGVTERSYGMVLVTGPTGSNKTVSLYTFLNRLNRDDINISAAKDPVETQSSSISQVSTNDRVGLAFVAVPRSLLRQDPDIVMVGGI